MAATVANAEVYFATQVLHNEEWTVVEPVQKQRTLANAKAQLYRIYRQYNENTKPIPDEAIYEQALWVLRIDDSIRKAEQGVRSVSVSGVSVAVDRVNLMVAPQAALILGRRVGRTVIY